MTLTFTCCTDTQSKQDHSTQQCAKMIQDLPVHMISSWEERRSWVGLKESTTQWCWERGPSRRELTRRQSRTILTASSTELTHTVEEESDLKESWCFSAAWRTSEMPRSSPEIQRELLHEIVYSLFIYHSIPLYWFIL